MDSDRLEGERAMTGSGNGGAAEPLSLQRFRVQNYRCIQDATLVLEPDVTVLVGRNDVGKTALLDALYLCGQVSANGLRAVTQDPDLAMSDPPVAFESTWCDVGADSCIRHRMVCSPGEPSEELDADGRHCVWDPRSRRLRVDERVYEAKGVRRSAFLGGIGLADWQTETDVPDDVARTLSRAAALRTPTPYLFQPAHLAIPTPIRQGPVRGSGLGWGSLLQDLVSARDERLLQLEEQVRKLFPFFRRVRAIEERYQITRQVTTPGYDELERSASAARETSLLHRLAEDESVRRVEVEVAAAAWRSAMTLFPTDPWVPAYSVSAGLLLAVAYLTVAYASPEGALLCLEEPENGLNEAIVLDMMRMLLAVVEERKLQLLMTTHNPYWLDLIGPRGVRVVTRNEAGTHVGQDEDNLRKILEEGIHLSEVMGLGGPDELLVPRR
jgi:hypothetical protein